MDRWRDGFNDVRLISRVFQRDDGTDQRAMRPTLVFLGIFLMQLVGQDPPIRHVPRVDSTFAGRLRLCPDVPYLSGASQPNDARRSVAQLLGTITAVDVHQFGRTFIDFAAVQTYLQGQLARRPRVLYRSVPWAEGTPLADSGVLGTLHFSTGSTGAFEATDVHLCAQDSSGVYWWIRLVPLDMWPPP